MVAMLHVADIGNAVSSVQYSDFLRALANLLRAEYEAETHAERPAGTLLSIPPKLLSPRAPHNRVP